MEGMKAQQVHAEETAHAQIASQEADNKGFKVKVTDTAHCMGTKASEMGHKVSATARGAAVTVKEAAHGYAEGTAKAIREAREGTAREMSIAQDNVTRRAQLVRDALTQPLDPEQSRLQRVKEALTENVDTGFDKDRTRLQGAQPDFGAFQQTGQFTDGNAGGFGTAKGNFIEDKEPGILPANQDPMFMPESARLSQDRGIHAPHSAPFTDADKVPSFMPMGQPQDKTTADKISETAGVAKETMVQKAHELQEGLAVAGQTALDATSHALLVAKDKVLDTAQKAREMVVGGKERTERKGSIPDANQTFSGYEKPSETVLGKDLNAQKQPDLLGKQDYMGKDLRDTNQFQAGASRASQGGVWL
jgi:hypothetical protein